MVISTEGGCALQQPASGGILLLSRPWYTPHVQTLQLVTYSPPDAVPWLCKRQKGDAAGAPCGSLRLAVFFFSVGPTGHMQTPEQVLEEQRQHKSQQQADTLPDFLVQLALRPEGPWQGLRSTASIMTAAMPLDGGRAVALEVSVRQGLKCIALRSLVVLGNETDVPLEVRRAWCPSACPVPACSGPTRPGENLLFCARGFSSVHFSPIPPCLSFVPLSSSSCLQTPPLEFLLL